jgi:hypothetical protein
MSSSIDDIRRGSSLDVRAMLRGQEPLELSVAGELMLRSAALDTDPEASKRFRRQLAKAMERSVFRDDAAV